MKKLFSTVSAILIGVGTAVGLNAYFEKKKKEERAVQEEPCNTEPCTKACEESVEQSAPVVPQVSVAAKGEQDPLFLQAVELAVKEQAASQALFRAGFGIGYNRAAAMVSAMEQLGMIGVPQAGKARPVYLSVMQEYLDAAKVC